MRGKVTMSKKLAGEMIVEINAQTDIVVARQAGREMIRDLGFGLADQTRLATAISELVRNVLQYAGKGVCVLTDQSDRQTLKLRVEVEDHGPGIADIEQALTDGFSTGNSLGAGLPGAKRLVHEFNIESQPGHTKVVLVISKQRLEGSMKQQRYRSGRG